MSNLILQSAAPSPLPYQQSHQLHMENVIDNALHWQAHALDQRIKGSRDVMDELDSLVASVNDLIGEPISSSTYPMSTSLPTSSSPAMQYRRRHSVEDRPLSPQDSPRLRYASDERAHRAPPPRALTQYVSVGSSNGDEEASQEGAQESSSSHPLLVRGPPLYALLFHRGRGPDHIATISLRILRLAPLEQGIICRRLYALHPRFHLPPLLHSPVRAPIPQGLKRARKREPQSQGPGSLLSRGDRVHRVAQWTSGP